MITPQEKLLLDAVDRRHAAEDRAREAELLLLQVALRLHLPAAGTTAEQTKRLIEGWLEDGAQ